MPTTLFLSYAPTDEASVADLYRRLQAAGFQPWMASRDILPGEDVRRSTERALRQAAFVLVCLSSRSVDQRGALQREIRQAVDRRQELLDDDIFLIPIRLEPCPLPDSLSGLWPVDLYVPDGFERLAAALRAGLAKRQESTEDQQLGETPQRAEETMKQGGETQTLRQPSVPPALADAWQRGRLAVVWGATPFELATGPLTRLVVVRRWQAIAAGLPPPDLSLAALPASPFLSLDPSSRLLDLFREQRVRVSVVRGPDEVVKPGEHGYYPLAGDLASQERLVLTRQDMQGIGQDDVKRRWMWEPWLKAARAGVVLLLGADPAHTTFCAWWDELLGPALKGVAVYAVGPSEGWPASVIPVELAALAELADFPPLPEETTRMTPAPAPPSPPPPPVPAADRLVVEVYGTTVKLTVQDIDYSGPNRIDPQELLAAGADFNLYGERLFQGIIHDQASPGGVRGRTTEAGFAIASHLARNQRLRLELRLDPNDLSLFGYRWEALKPPGDDTPLALHGGYLLYRYQAGRSDDLLVTTEKLKVLAAISSPITLGVPGSGILEQLSPLDIDQERQSIENGLRRLRDSGAVEFTILDRQHGAPITRGRIFDALQEGYNVLHLVAHGIVAAGRSKTEFYLVLEKENGEEHFVPAGDFVRLASGTDLRLVVLVSCQSGVRTDDAASLALGSRLVQAGIPAVIAMQDVLPIDAARSFTQRFYDAVARSGHVDLAMAVARQGMWLDATNEGADTGTWSIPALTVSKPGGKLFEIGHAQQPQSPASTVPIRDASGQASSAEPAKPSASAEQTNLPPAADAGSQAISKTLSPPPQTEQPPIRTKLYPSQVRHLETRHAELESERTTLSKRISALSTDIGRTLDSMQRQILEERKAELVNRRDQVSQEMAEIEAQLDAG